MCVFLFFFCQSVLFLYIFVLNPYIGFEFNALVFPRVLPSCSSSFYPFTPFSVFCTVHPFRFFRYIFFRFLSFPSLPFPFLRFILFPFLFLSLPFLSFPLASFPSLPSPFISFPLASLPFFSFHFILFLLSPLLSLPFVSIPFSVPFLPLHLFLFLLLTPSPFNYGFSIIFFSKFSLSFPFISSILIPFSPSSSRSFLTSG